MDNDETEREHISKTKFFLLLLQQHDFLLKIKEEQRRARRETWMDNLATTILGTPVASRKRSTSKVADVYFCIKNCSIFPITHLSCFFYLFWVGLLGFLAIEC